MSSFDRSTLGVPLRPGCLPAGASVELKAARHILRESFEAVKMVYLRAQADKVKGVKLKVDDSARSKDRHFAMCSTDGSHIVLAPDMALLPPKTMAAIMAHEFGHAVDFLYPGSFIIKRDGKLDVMPTGRRSNQGMDRGRFDYWERRSDDDVERTADLIAERIFGSNIGYCGPCRLQTFLDGSADQRDCLHPRPTGLR